MPHWADVIVSTTPLGIGLVVGLEVTTPVSAKGRYKEVGESGRPRPNDTPNNEVLEKAHKSAIRAVVSKVELESPTQAGVLLGLASAPSLRDPLREREATSPWDQGCTTMA
jgi:hypothetical protein